MASQAVSFDSNWGEAVGKEQSAGRSRANNQTISILITDDHPVVRFGLANLLSAQPDFTVVDQAASCAELREKTEMLQPDILLIDLELGDVTGACALERLRELSPNSRIIVFTAYTDDQHVMASLEVGVDGYVVKDMSNERLCDAIRIVYNGGTYLDPTVASKVTRRLYANRQAPTREQLTARERAVLDFVAVGKRNREIAKVLFISESTVKFHIGSLMSKLGAKNRTEAVNIALAQKIIDP